MRIVFFGTPTFAAEILKQHILDMPRKAVLGIVSSLSYILWGAITLFGSSLTMAWIFCGIALL